MDGKMKRFTLKDVLEQLKEGAVIFEADAEEIDLVKVLNTPSTGEIIDILSKHGKLMYEAGFRIGACIYAVDLYKVSNSQNEIKYVVMLTGFTGYIQTYMRVEGYETFNDAVERTRELIIKINI